MTTLELKEIEDRANAAQAEWHLLLGFTKTEVPKLIAAVRERDAKLAKAKDALQAIEFLKLDKYGSDAEWFKVNALGFARQALEELE